MQHLATEETRGSPLPNDALILALGQEKTMNPATLKKTVRNWTKRRRRTLLASLTDEESLELLLKTSGDTTEMLEALEVKLKHQHLPEREAELYLLLKYPCWFYVHFPLKTQRETRERYKKAYPFYDECSETDDTLSIWSFCVAELANLREKGFGVNVIEDLAQRAYRLSLPYFKYSKHYLGRARTFFESEKGLMEAVAETELISYLFALPKPGHLAVALLLTGFFLPDGRLFSTEGLLTIAQTIPLSRPALQKLLRAWEEASHALEEEAYYKATELLFQYQISFAAVGDASQAEIMHILKMQHWSRGVKTGERIIESCLFPGADLLLARIGHVPSTQSEYDRLLENATDEAFVYFLGLKDFLDCYVTSASAERCLSLVERISDFGSLENLAALPVAPPVTADPEMLRSILFRCANGRADAFLQCPFLEINTANGRLLHLLCVDMTIMENIDAFFLLLKHPMLDVDLYPDGAQHAFLEMLLNESILSEFKVLLIRLFLAKNPHMTPMEREDSLLLLQMMKDDHERRYDIIKLERGISGHSLALTPMESREVVLDYLRVFMSRIAAHSG